jgi:hypothetical protein
MAVPVLPLVYHLNLAVILYFLLYKFLLNLGVTLNTENDKIIAVYGTRNKNVGSYGDKKYVTRIYFLKVDDD